MSWTGYDLSAFVGILVISVFGLWVGADFVQGKLHDKRMKMLGLRFAEERDRRERIAKSLK